MVSMKYQESYVYKIQSLVTDDYFIASTTQKASQRIKTLRRNYREYKAGKPPHAKSWVQGITPTKSLKKSSVDPKWSCGR